MSNSFFGEAFSGRGGAASGWPMSAITEAMDQLRSAVEKGMGGSAPRMNRGDVRAAVLTLLLERPMHGYQIIQAIEKRTLGAWKPSPGSIYPTLQLLADEGLVVAEETSGKKVFSLTEAGRTAVDELAEEPAPWDVAAAIGDCNGLFGLREAGGRLASAVMQVGRSGDRAKIDQAAEILNAARKQVYALLAED